MTLAAARHLGTQAASQRAERVAIEARLAALNEVLAPVEDDERAARARLRDAEARALGPWVLSDPPLRWVSGQLHLASQQHERWWGSRRAWLRVVTGGGDASIGQPGPRYARWTLDLRPLGSAGTVQRVLGDAGADPAGEWLRHRAEAERLLRAEGYVLTAPGQEVRDGGQRPGGAAR